MPLRSTRMAHDRLDKFVDFLVKQAIIPDKPYIRAALAEEVGHFVPEEQRVFFYPCHSPRTHGAFLARLSLDRPGTHA
jgi:hypothetical protein